MAMTAIEELKIKASLNRKIRKENLEKEFRELMDELFLYDQTLLMIIFIGSTPGFNDGDVCEHRLELYIIADNGIFTNNGYGILEDHLEDSNDLDSNTGEKYLSKLFGIKLLKPIYLDLLKATDKLSKEVIDIVVNQDLTDLMYDTNYMVVVNRNSNGNISIKKSNYDCGY